jgi:integrative and conjugative element protein (TIGR02256 family)
MAENLYSKCLPEFTDVISNTFLKESISELARYMDLEALSILKWGNNYIGIPIQVSIDLPPLGNYDNVDIRKEEDVIVLFHVNDYPSIAPLICTDRLDFPKNELAHLYVATGNRPPGLCLVRGDRNEWYADKTVKDLCIRARNWFRDAATGQLSEDGNQFDPVRLEGYYGTAIYSHEKLSDIVRQRKSFCEGENFALSVFESEFQKTDSPSFKFIDIIPKEGSEDVFSQYVKYLGGLISKKSVKLRKFHIGYIIWSTEEEPVPFYQVDLPKNWKGFRDFCRRYSIDTSSLEAFIVNFEYTIFEVPIIVGIKRPKPVIGFESVYEFFNFFLDIKDEDKYKATQSLNDSNQVSFQIHNEVLTRSKARLISGKNNQFENNSVIVGCGALGSKVSLHFIRSGFLNLALFDHDVVSPHNMIRNGLTPEFIGMNKAKALEKLAKEMFPEESGNVAGFSLRGNTIFPKIESGNKNPEWFFDFTASESFLNALINQRELLNESNICRGFLTDSSNLGVLFLEGENRNSRIDDLQVMLYFMANEKEWIADWLQRELNTDDNSLLHRVGLGCNSETTVSPDDAISLHSGYFSKALTSEFERSVRKGKMYLNRTFFDPDFQVSSDTLIMDPVDVMIPENNKAWEIRYRGGLVKLLRSEMIHSMPNETGGVLVGTVNYKTKVIHVMDVIKAPEDSEATSHRFFRGVKSLSERIEALNTKTGGQLGYVGEWHTHPDGPEKISNVDRETVDLFRKDFDESHIRLPVFLMILTPKKILTYIH